MARLRLQGGSVVRSYVNGFASPASDTSKIGSGHLRSYDKLN